MRTAVQRPEGSAPGRWTARGWTAVSRKLSSAPRPRTGYGLPPPAHWARAGALSARGEPEERVLLRLWGRTPAG
nr:hypothetical protein OG781_20845 [Streptomyces sp. NBC_00830]